MFDLTNEMQDLLSIEFSTTQECNLEYIDELLAIRKQQCEFYDLLLEQMPVRRPGIQQYTDFNHAYYAILFNTEEETVNTLTNLEVNGISPRRYFYPSLTELDYVEGECPISLDISKRILCLPLYHELSKEDQIKVKSVLQNRRSYANCGSW